MSSSHKAPQDEEFREDEEPAMLDADEADEEIEQDNDATMDSGDEEDDMLQEEELTLQNDSSAHFDAFKDSIFCIAQHPLHPHIVAAGGSEGEDAGGIGFIFDSTVTEAPVLPPSYQTAPNEYQERKSLKAIYTLEGHTDSINALTFTLPRGDYLLSGGLDGKLRAYAADKSSRWQLLGEAQEVQEINWLSSCPHPTYPNTVALGASDGSVWVYTVDGKAGDAPLQIVQSYFLHGGPSTAGSWTADGKLLATVSEDSSLYVWDVFGEAAAAGVVQSGSQTVVALTADDQRFAVDGGLYSVACSPNGSFLVVGGAGGAIKVVGLPRLGDDTAADRSANGPASKSKTAKGGKAAPARSSVSQAGQILADLNAQSDGIETLAFPTASSNLSLFAAGSVDGSIVLYDSAHRFAVRRHIKEAHSDFSVVKVEFVKAAAHVWEITSCGMDGMVRRWDTRGGTATPNSGLIREWAGHRGDGEGGGILAFVQGTGDRIVTAGDDGISLVFEAF